MPKRQRRKNSHQLRKPQRPDSCPVCASNLSLDYKNAAGLRKFLTDRFKVLPRSVSGVCARHQRMLSYEIKKARQMSLLPYTDQHAL